MTAVQEFKQRFNQDKERGLIDLKFVVGNTYGATIERFCEEANLIDQAIENNQFTISSWLCLKTENI